MSQNSVCALFVVGAVCNDVCVFVCLLVGSTHTHYKTTLYDCELTLHFSRRERGWFYTLYNIFKWQHVGNAMNVLCTGFLQDRRAREDIVRTVGI